MYDCSPALDEIRHPQKDTASHLQLLNCHNLAAMWLNVGGPYHLDSFGCQPNPSQPSPERLQPLVRPHFVTMAIGQTRGGASVFHLVAPAAQALLLWHAWSVSEPACWLVFLCLYIILVLYYRSDCTHKYYLNIKWHFYRTNKATNQRIYLKCKRTQS